MNDEAPTREPAGTSWSSSWVLWFKKVQLALFGWNRTFTQSFDYDFPSIPAGSQLSAIAIIEGVRPGAAVVISPAADTPGIAYAAVATSANNVTIYAKNYTAGAIDPPNTDFRVIVFQ